MQQTKKIGRRDEATKTRKCGGKAFPGDYNWTCRECGRDNRAFELTCGYCEHDAFMRGEADEVEAAQKAQSEADAVQMVSLNGEKMTMRECTHKLFNNLLAM